MWHSIQIRGLAIWRSVSNQRLCSWRSKPFVRCISVSIKGFFLKLYITYRTDVRYSSCTFGGDQSVMKDALPEKQALSWRFIGFRWRDFPNNSHLSLYVNLLETLCGCWPVIRIKVCQLNSCVTGPLYLGCHVQLFLNIHPPLHVHSLYSV